MDPNQFENICAGELALRNVGREQLVCFCREHGKLHFGVASL
jgi:hypothetical protein